MNEEFNQTAEQLFGYEQVAKWMILSAWPKTEKQLFDHEQVMKRTILPAWLQYNRRNTWKYI